MPQNSSLQPIARQSLSDAIIDQIIGLIAAGTLCPGDRLPPERELCRQLGVGRTSLREALKSLTAVGIVQGRVGEGTFVSADSAGFLERSVRWGLLLDRKSIEDLVEARIMLESQTASSAAERAEPDDLAELARTIDDLSNNLENQAAFLEADLQFHTAIARISRNAFLVSMLALTRNSLQQWIERSLADPLSPAGRKRAKLSLAQHRAIRQAIADRNPDGARAAMAAHLLSSSHDLRSI